MPSPAWQRGVGNPWQRRGGCLRRRGQILPSLPEAPPPGFWVKISGRQQEGESHCDTSAPSALGPPATMGADEGGRQVPPLPLSTHPDAPPGTSRPFSPYAVKTQPSQGRPHPWSPEDSKVKWKTHFRPVMGLPGNLSEGVGMATAPPGHSAWTTQFSLGSLQALGTDPSFPDATPPSLARCWPGLFSLPQGLFWGATNHPLLPTNFTLNKAQSLACLLARNFA